MGLSLRFLRGHFTEKVVSSPPGAGGRETCGHLVPVLKLVWLQQPGGGGRRPAHPDWQPQRQQIEHPNFYPDLLAQADAALSQRFSEISPALAPGDSATADAPDAPSLCLSGRIWVGIGAFVLLAGAAEPI